MYQSVLYKVHKEANVKASTLRFSFDIGFLSNLDNIPYMYNKGEPTSENCDKTLHFSALFPLATSEASGKWKSDVASDFD